MAYEIVPVRPELRRAAAELLASSMNRDPAVTERYLEWRFERAPHAHGTTLWLALDGERVVGMRGCYPTLWSLPGSHERVILPSFCDTAVAPDHSSNGVFGGIMVTALDALRGHGHRYVINLSATPVALLDSLATGWRAVGQPTILRRLPLSLRMRSRAAAVPTLRSAYHRVRPEGEARTVGDPFVALDAAAETEKRVAADVGAALATRQPDGRSIDAACDAPYLEWLLGNPAQSHRVVASRAGGRVTACLLLRGAVGLSRVVAVDWYADSPGELARLAADVAHAGRWPELDIWSGPCDARELEPFLSAGFVAGSTPRAAALLIRTTGAAAPGEWRLGGVNLLAADAWRVRLLQSPLWLVPSADTPEIVPAPARHATLA